MGCGKVNADGALRGIGALVSPVSDGAGGAGVGVAERAAVAFAGGRIAWIGRDRGFNRAVSLGRRARVIDAGGRAAIPGLVDCHTHTIFAGSRVDDFARRCAGESYADIARAGGGIVSTVAATRAATGRALVDLGRARLDAFAARGVTTVEIKSGYGLDTTTEVRILGAAAALGRAHPITVVPTFLGAHTVPPEYRGRRRDYVELLIREMIPLVARRRLAAFCDVFCDETAFSVAEAREVLAAGARHGLRPKVHADQISPGGGADLAAAMGAVSADHLEHVSDRGVAMMRGAGVVAVVLPLAPLFTGSTDRAPARKMLDAGVRVAVSTDFNPGSSHTQDLALAGTVACAQLKMSPAETLAAVTVNAAAALAMDGDIGTIERGKQADLVVLETKDWRDIFYCMGENLARIVIKKGKVVCAR